MKFLLFISFLILPILAQAQGEHTGHGRQRQQQQQQGFYKRVVIRGDEAERLFKEYSASRTIEDLSLQCTSPVYAVYLPEYDGESSVCFDRGEGFWADRYKCYAYELVPGLRIRLIPFNWFHNSCGGDGIYPLE